MVQLAGVDQAGEEVTHLGTPLGAEEERVLRIAQVQFARVEQKAWKNPAADAYNYGLAFGKFFGPSSRDLVESVEIGNEPGHYDDAFYRTIFENMAKGFRAADPKLKVITDGHAMAEELGLMIGIANATADRLLAARREAPDVSPQCQELAA